MHDKLVRQVQLICGDTCASAEEISQLLTLENGSVDKVIDIVFSGADNIKVRSAFFRFSLLSI